MQIDRFIGAMRFGGARTSNFLVQITNPIDGSGDIDFQWKCKAASIPAYAQEKVTTNFMAREVHFQGKRTFENWTVTILNDEDFVIRKALENWMNAMDSIEGHVNTTGSSNPANYKAQGTITQYDKNDNVLEVYKFIGLFPVNISAIETTWDENAIETYTVEFSVDYCGNEDQIS